MRFRQGQNRDKTVNAEKWAKRRLIESGHKWAHQTMWGCRIFDFWCHRLGIAVEVDGPEHRIDFDNARDRYNYYRSGILILRVRNFSDEDMDAAAGAARP